MFGLICTGVVVVLAFYGVVSGLRSRTFQVGRGPAPRAISLSSNPIGFWATAVILSVICGAGLGILLFAAVHR